MHKMYVTDDLPLNLKSLFGSILKANYAADSKVETFHQKGAGMRALRATVVERIEQAINFCAQRFKLRETDDTSPSLERTCSLSTTSDVPTGKTCGRVENFEQMHLEVLLYLVP